MAAGNRLGPYINTFPRQQRKPQESIAQRGHVMGLCQQNIYVTVACNFETGLENPR